MTSLGDVVRKQRKPDTFRGQWCGLNERTEGGVLKRKNKGDLTVVS